MTRTPIASAWKTPCDAASPGAGAAGRRYPGPCAGRATDRLSAFRERASRAPGYVACRPRRGEARRALAPSDGAGRGNKGAYIFAEHRLIGTREDDATGLAGWLRFGVADTRYNAIGTAWLSVQPDVQYVINPGGDPRLGDALIVGIRVKVRR